MATIYSKYNRKNSLIKKCYKGNISVYINWVAIPLQCDKTQSNGNDKTTHKSCSDKCRVLGDQNSNTTLASMESCRISGTPERQMKNGSMNSDCGYSSDVEGCECSMPSSNEGSDILCDGRCSSHDGNKFTFQNII